MASPVLHIKDSYYFEVPKGLWPQGFSSKKEFTGAYETWLRLDPQFQLWEAQRFYEEYTKLSPSPAPKDELISRYLQWKETGHANTGKPFWRFIQEEGDREWFQQRSQSSAFRDQWHNAIEATSGPEALTAFRNDASPQWTWSSEKLAAYNRHLSGKILIPQPFARLRNLYEKEWGVGISRFLLIEIGVAIVLWAAFSWLAKRVTGEPRPRGALWNLLEALVVFVRDEIARPVIGHEPAHARSHVHEAHVHEAHGHESHGHESHGHAPDSPADHAGAGRTLGGPHVADSAGDGETVEGGHEPGHHHDPRYDADRFVPLLLTIFLFVLGCNLAGMLPWVGAPTGEWGTTSAIAIVTFATGVLFGMRRFGVGGYFLNQIPSMDVPVFMAVLLKPLILMIELAGLLIKHAILSVRLLANMVAGHIVLLSIMALAFSLEGVVGSGSVWPLTAAISVTGSVLLSCLELFVAFLQAYIFAFLSAMFIGAALHSH
ncbi:MAG: F0F1 ATP synthase subunit A [Pirellulaceae bacterium]